MRLEAKIYEDLKIEVTNLLEEYGVNSVPIDPFKLAEQMGLTLIPYSSLTERKLKSILGFDDGLSYGNDRNGVWHIYYNDKIQSAGRIRQTIMHEIAHYWLGHTGSPEQEEQEEAEAKFFAAYALAPIPIVISICDINNSDDIRETFQISEKAAIYVARRIHNRRSYGGTIKDYEIRLLKMFGLWQGGDTDNSNG